VSVEVTGVRPAALPSLPSTSGAVPAPARPRADGAPPKVAGPRPAPGAGSPAGAGTRLDVAVPGDGPTIDRAVLDAYARRLSDAAGRNAIYPRRLQNLGIEGTTVVQVRIGRGSKMLDVTVVETSGNRQLDEAAVESMRRTRPLPTVPDGLNGRELVVKIPFRFKLE
jgi:protein TonB